MQSRCRSVFLLLAASLTCGLMLMGGCPIPPQPATQFRQTNLVSDGSQSATFNDTNLVNPWGLGQLAGGPFWVADNATGVATVYNGTGQAFPTDSPLIVTIPAAPGNTGSAPVTGLVANVFADQGDFDGNAFIFVTEGGTIAAWKQSDGNTATLVVDNSGTGETVPVYKGATLITNDSGNFLLVADFRNARIDVFNRAFMAISLQGTFADDTIPAGFAPFNVQTLNGKVYVAYARQDETGEDDVPGAGAGYVNEFDTNGTLRRRIASTGTLNAPWGLAIGPSTWGEFAGALIVGNFGDGKINAFTLGTTPAFIATLQDENGSDIVIPVLWALVPGNGAQGTDAQKLYLTAGGQNEDQGLFASLERVQ